MAPDPKYYQNYTDEQFAADEYFQQWVLSTDAARDEFWNNYLTNNQHQETILFKARLLVEVLAADERSPRPLLESEKKILKEKIYHQLKLTLPSIEPVRVHTKTGWLQTAAAVLLLFAAISGYLMRKPVTDLAMVVETTGSRDTREILLADSSVVILNANSSLQYKKDFLRGSSRVVYLEGNAFFKIKKDITRKTFVVNSRALSITVLGTQFNVNARSKAIQVILASGKVKVSMKENAGSEIFMEPGERMALDTLKHALIKTKTDVSVYSAWTKGEWNFQNTSLEDIGELIRAYYGVNTVILHDKNRYLKMSAVMPVSDLQTLQHVISKTLHIKLEEINNQLIIQ